MSTPTLTDYVTTETVMQAFSGAKDLAQAGAEATVTYFWWQSVLGCIVSALFIIIYPICLYLGYKKYRVFKARPNKPFLSDDDMAADLTMIFAFIGAVAGLPVMTSILCANLPAVISPEGALLYKIVTGVAQ